MIDLKKGKGHVQMVFEGNFCIRGCAWVDVVSDEPMMKSWVGFLELFQKGKVRRRLLFL